MWLVPSRRRVNHLQRQMKALADTGTSTPGWIIVDLQDYIDNKAGYDALALPPQWKIIVSETETMGDKLRELWPQYKDQPWIGLMGDDNIPETQNWDTLLIGELKGWNIVSSNDGWQAPNRMAGATLWSGDVLRAVGYLYPSGLQHLFIDDIWETIGRETGCWFVRMDVMVRHDNALKTGIKDETHEKAYGQWPQDQTRYELWRKDEMFGLIAAVRLNAKRHGVGLLNPNFSGVKLLIATPAASGEYEASFVWSLMATMEMLRGANVPHRWLQELYNADICAARAKLLSYFLHREDMKEFTHILLIDSDMGWSNDALLRVFAAKKDLVCVAGPKKCYPINFAVNHANKDGTPIPIQNDIESGAAEVSHVGMAFALVSRNCAQKIVDAYPELTYEAYGEEFHAVYNSMVEDRRYYAEDFAFCQRWRKIGGTVYVCPDVPLKHTGKHTFEGKLTDMAAPVNRAGETQVTMKAA